jgi:hypothetical protein
MQQIQRLERFAIALLGELDQAAQVVRVGSRDGAHS